MKSIINIILSISLLAFHNHSAAQNPINLADSTVIGQTIGLLVATESDNHVNIEWDLFNSLSNTTYDCTDENQGDYPELTDVLCDSINSIQIFISEAPIDFNLWSNATTFSSNQDYLNGVSTLDMVLITRHILGINTFDSEYKKLAADINNNGSISAVDLLEMRRLILGIYNELPNQVSWIAFADEVIEDFNYDIPVVGCTAVKIGDINGSAISGLQSNNQVVENRSTTYLTIEDQKIKSGVPYSIAVSANEDLAIYGLQLTLDSDQTQISDLSIESAALTITPESIHNQASASGKTSIAWMDVDNNEIEKNKTLFYVTFMANEDAYLSDVLQLTEAPTPSLMVNQKLEEEIIDLKYITSTSELRVFPNPTNDVLQIFGVSEGISQSKLYDQFGKVVLSKSHSGNTELLVDNLNNGIYFLQLESEEGIIQTQKIVIQH